MMMKKSWKNRSAVSPVIATILMVAITVVLAAVLYVMVIGFNQGTSSAPTATMSKQAGESRIVISPSQALDMTNFKITTTINGTTETTAVGTLSDADGVFTFVDAGTDGKVTAGDYWLVAPNNAGNSISLIYVSGDTSTDIADCTW
jgi:flagellin-like protein